MMIDFISLIITNYNRDRYLPEAIESVLAQTHPHFELLIWDDGSTDNSLDIAHSYTQKDSRIRVHAAPHQGIAPALKAAVAHTTAPYLGWVDSDDKLAPTALEDTIAILNDHPDVGMVYTNHEIIDAQGNAYGLGKRCHTPYSKERLLIEFMTFHFRLMRRSVYEQVGGIDPSFQWAEDYDLCLKLSEVTEIYHLPKPLYFYRRHDQNLTNHQYDTISWAKIAIEQAIVRRGLHQDYQLDIQLVGQFKLSPRSVDVPHYFAIPLVSVIISTHNRLTLLDRALKSVLAQTYAHYEIIVVDDGSTDRTTAWLETQYPQIRLITLVDNQGAAAARNQGAAIAHGHFLAFLDSDDEWHPHYLQRQLDTIAQHPEAVLVYSNYLCSFAEADAGTPVTLPAGQKDSITAMLQECFIHTLSQVVLPTIRFRQIGGFDAQFRCCYDWDFYLRLFHLGKPVHCPDYLVRRYWLPDRVATQGQNWLENGLRVLNLFYQRPENDCYASLQSVAKDNLRHTVARTQHWLIESFQKLAHTTTRVSIILACLDAEADIIDCLNCCLAQTETPLEVIVVDRGSTDDTIALIQQCAATAAYPVRLLQATGASRNAARNLGFEAAQGNYIQWLEPGDRLSSDQLARQIQALEQHPAADIAVSDWEWCGVNAEQIVAEFTFASPAPAEMLLHLLLDAGCPTSAHLLRRAAAMQLHQLQAWHPQAQADDDREYFTLAALLGLRFCRVEGISVQKRCAVASLPLHPLSTVDRVQNRQRMFARFHDIAVIRSSDTLQPVHWHLLRQDWNLWSVAFTLVPGADQSLAIQHSHSQTVMAIEPAKLPVIQALLQAGQARTLEDHSRVIVQKLWCDLLIRISRSAQSDSLGNFALLSEALASRVGLDETSPSVQLLVQELDRTRFDGAIVNSEGIYLSQWLLDVPLFSPLFVRHRLQVYTVLDQLRQQGWLVKSPQSTSEGCTLELQTHKDRLANAVRIN